MSLRSILASEGLIAASRTLMTCRTCGTSVRGTTGGTVSKPGWHKILRIDGPNAMCPECVKDKDALEGLAEDGYLDAKIGPEMPSDPSIKSAALVLKKGDYIEVSFATAVTPESVHGVPPPVVLTKPAVFQFDSYSNWPSDGMLRARRMTWNGIRGNTPTMGKWFKIPPDAKMKKLDNLDDRQVLYNA